MKKLKKTIIMLKLKDNKVVRIISLIFLLAIACIILTVPKSKIAFASESALVEFSYATCDVLDVETLEYTQQVFEVENSIYKKNIILHFQITTNGNDLEYGFGSNVENVFSRIPISEDKEVSYQVMESGTFNIGCFLFSGANLIDEAMVTVKSDIDIPDNFGPKIFMDKYQSVGTYFDVTFDTFSFVDSDKLSGFKEAYYSYESKNLPSENISYRKAAEGINTFRITNNGTLFITYIDHAGNFSNDKHELNKYDSIPPQVPKIIITADSDMDFSGGYTKSYTVNIEYGKDNESGTAPQQYYVENGVTKLYTAPFKLTRPSFTIDKQITIQAKTIDKVGNSSNFVIEYISDNNFDIAMPIITSVQFNVDLTKEKPYSISFIANDLLSGMDNSKVYIEGMNLLFTSGANNTYYAEFLPFGKSSLVIHAFDKVGNDAIHHMVINYFGDTNRSKTLEKYYNTYHSLDFSLYTQNVVDTIKAAYTQLNVILMAGDTQNSQFDMQFSKIDQLILGSSNHVYIIESVPRFISSSLKYKIEETDFAEYKKGDSVKLVLNALTLDNEKNYVKLADFSKGFAEAFNLSAYYKEEMLTNLTSGIEIEMNLPFGYYERKFVILNKATNEIVPTTIYNNQIAFTLKDSGDYVMVISGDKSIDTSVPKTIKVFGKAMPYPTFFGIIFGTLGGVIVIVGVLIVIKKKKG